MVEIMAFCYYCGGYIEPKHRADADIGDGQKSPAHVSCAEENSEEDYVML